MQPLNAPNQIPFSFPDSQDETYWLLKLSMELAGTHLPRLLGIIKEDLRC